MTTNTQAALRMALEEIAASWDGCEVDSVGETLDVGAQLRKQFATLLHPAIKESLTTAQALEPELHRLREIARLIGSIFVHGGFVAETHNERELEKLLREQGTFWTSLAEYDAAIEADRNKRALSPAADAVSTDDIYKLVAEHEEPGGLWELPTFTHDGILRFSRALLSLASQPKDEGKAIPRTALREFIDKFCAGDSALIATAESAYHAFNESLAAAPSAQEAGALSDEEADRIHAEASKVSHAAFMSGATLAEWKRSFIREILVAAQGGKK